MKTTNHSSDGAEKNRNETPENTIEYQENSFYEQLETTILPGCSLLPTICAECDVPVRCQRMFRVIPVTCRKCREEINVAYVEVADFEVFFPEHFTKKEAQLAKLYNVCLRRSPHTLEPEGLENHCEHCGDHYGEFSLAPKIGHKRPICNILSGYLCWRGRPENC